MTVILRLSLKIMNVFWEIAHRKLYVCMLFLVVINSDLQILHGEFRNEHFKNALVSFLIENWTSDKLAPFIGSKVMCLNFDYCYEYTAENNKIIRNICEDLSCFEHRKANTKIIYHVCNITFTIQMFYKMLQYFCYYTRKYG